MLSGYDVFKIYLPLHRHFTSDYDFFDSRGGGVGNTNLLYGKRTERYTFEKIGVRRGNKQEVFRFFVSQLEINPDKNIRDMYGLEADKAFLSYNSRIAAMDYKFVEAIKMLHNMEYSWKEILLIGEIPLISRMVSCGDITKETILILDTLFNIFDKWEKNVITDDIIFRMRNYSKFVNINKELYTELFKDNT